MEKAQRKNIATGVGIVVFLLIYFALREQVMSDFHANKGNFMVAMGYFVLMLGLDIVMFYNQSKENRIEFGCYWFFGWMLFIAETLMEFQDFMFGFGLFAAWFGQKIPLLGLEYLFDDVVMVHLMVGGYILLHLGYALYLNHQIADKIRWYVALVIGVVTGIGLFVGYERFL